MRYNLVYGADVATVTVFHDGEMYTADEKHPSFNEIVARCEADDTSAIELFDISRAISTKFQRLTDRLMVSHGHVYFDGDEVKDIIVDHILEHLEIGTDFKPLARFLENLYANPNPHSREQLYRWLHATKGFTITNTGNILGYKGVTKNGDKYVSCHSGYAIVNGQEVNGPVPNDPGNIVEMPRSQVTFDPGTGCSVGLHIGTYEYAKGYGNIVLQVEVNPRDVVSVPTDASDKKMRCCRYKVISECSAKLTFPITNITAGLNYSTSNYYNSTLNEFITWLDRNMDYNFKLTTNK